MRLIFFPDSEIVVGGDHIQPVASFEDSVYLFVVPAIRPDTVLFLFLHGVRFDIDAVLDSISAEGEDFSHFATHDDSCSV